jgi:hypothetical protein
LVADNEEGRANSQWLYEPACAMPEVKKRRVYPEGTPSEEALLFVLIHRSFSEGGYATLLPAFAKATAGKGSSTLCLPLITCPALQREPFFFLFLLILLLSAVLLYPRSCSVWVFTSVIHCLENNPQIFFLSLHQPNILNQTEVELTETILLHYSSELL